MLRQRRLMGFILPLAVVGLISFAQETFAQKVKTEQIVYTPPTLSLTAEPSTVMTCAGDTGQSGLVRLNARATSPSGSSIRYNWSHTEGRIDGDGPVVTWDLTGLKPGYYKAYVEIETGSPDEACQAFASTTVLVKCTPPPPPVCPNISIACPQEIAPDQPVTFVATLSGGSGNVVSTYNWTLTAGTIIEGQGTPTIKVDTTGLAGQALTATLSMTGFPQDCSASCTVQIPIPKSPSKKFDEFPDISRNDEKARLDNYAVELQNDPTATAYVIVYPGRNSRSGDVQKHTSRIVDYLVNSRGIDARRIVTMVGPVQKELMIELWISPQGATLPTPGP
jgi:hypothetical protein